MILITLNGEKEFIDIFPSETERKEVAHILLVFLGNISWNGTSVWKWPGD
jgi:hypothetical protein